jgi:isoleucyl-tRNA synthetase
MKAVMLALAKLDQHDITRFEREGRYLVNADGEEIELSLSEVEITSEDIPGWSVASNGALTVALDTTLTPDLEQEGNAREFINRIQKIRKDSGFELTDRINVLIDANNGIRASLAKYYDYICAEILADSLDFQTNINGGIAIEVNDNPLNVTVTKKGNHNGNEKSST